MFTRLREVLSVPVRSDMLICSRSYSREVKMNHLVGSFRDNADNEAIFLNSEPLYEPINGMVYLVLFLVVQRII